MPPGKEGRGEFTTAGCCVYTWISDIWLEAIRVAGRGLVDHQVSSVVPFSVLYTPQVSSEALRQDPAVTQWLRITGHSADWLLGLNVGADLIELEPAEIYPLPSLLAQRSNFEPLKALGFHQQRLVALLDVDLLEQCYRQISRI
ncbi:hypothetical protein LH51_07835 [Nitrincola sp. A-D6]|uniref:hypothetical protein n=1 Tax=Nitrincola sp. A-D6 TaxID=1545442 RepID=UPI00051FE4EF|nr:hypothetical protein [Nitrincola sp. A-D6]KGK42411.1 hypothetical protein LH51_07835 [Nitrincola sp. A-D6]